MGRQEQSCRKLGDWNIVADAAYYTLEEEGICKSSDAVEQKLAKEN